MSEVLPTNEPRLYIAGQFSELVLPAIEVRLQPLADQYLEETLAAYSQPDRHHHNLVHIMDCLQKLEPYSDREDYLQLWLALFQHDEVYKTGHGSEYNELDSGDMAYWRATALHLPGGGTVKRIIISTKEHTSEVEDEALACSIDMSILAEPEPVYDAYAAGIRQEYSWVPEEIYVENRIRILKSFGVAFHHPDFVHLNPAAQANMEREIANLAA